MPTSSLKAIETRYNGYRFRSRLEARWAVYLDTVGLDYEYEPEGFVLENGERYLPDFWLPSVQHWAEVKAQNLSLDEMSRCALLVKGTRYPCVLLVGTPEYKAYETLGFGPGEYSHRVTPGLPEGIVVCDAFVDASYVSERRFYVCTGGGDAFDPDAKRAVQAARGARFEHGESGPRR